MADKLLILLSDNIYATYGTLWHPEHQQHYVAKAAAIPFHS